MKHIWVPLQELDKKRRLGKLSNAKTDSQGMADFRLAVLAHGLIQRRRVRAWKSCKRLEVFPLDSAHGDSGLREQAPTIASHGATVFPATSSALSLAGSESKSPSGAKGRLC